MLDSAFAAFPGWQSNPVPWAESVTLFALQAGEELPNVNLRLAEYDQLADHASLTSGRWPADNGSAVEIVLLAQVADALDLTVGESLTLEQRGWETSVPFTAEVVGTFTVDDPQDPYWMAPSPIRIDNSGDGLETNVFTTRATLEEALAQYLPAARAQTGWRVLFDHSQLRFQVIDSARDVLNGLERTLEEALAQAAGDDVTLIYQTNLSSVLGNYQDEIGVLRAPFNLFLLQLGALVIFFLVVMGALVRRGERREISMLKSRGVRDRQILLLRTVETAIICLLATLAAPTLARLVLLLLLPIFTDVGTIPLTIDSAAYWAAGLASFAALIALVGTLIPVLRTPLVLTAGYANRRQGPVWWQKYYLDIILLVIGLGAMVQLLGQGSLIEENAAGELQTDPLLLLVPTLLVFALGSVSLRIFPAVMNAAARFFYRRQALAPVIASLQVSREPIHYGRITFLLALAISIGWFAVSFQRSVVQSQIDQARYRVGGDLVIEYDADTPDARLSDVLGDADTATAEVLRLDDVSTALQSFGLETADLLAVNAATLPDAVDWRSDLGAIIPPPAEGLPDAVGVALPPDVATIEVQGLYHDVVAGFGIISGEPQVHPFQLLGDSLTVNLRFRATNSEIFIVPLVPDGTDFLDYVSSQQPETPQGEMPPPFTDYTSIAEYPAGGWLSMQADLTTIADDLRRGARFEGVVIRVAASGFGSSFVFSPNLFLRDMTLIDVEGDSSPVDWLTQTQEWSFVNGRGALEVPVPRNPFEDVDPELRAQSLRIGWTQQTDDAQLGTLYNYPAIYTTEDPTIETAQADDTTINGIPAIVSQSFAQDNNLSVGQTFRLFFSQQVVWFQVGQINRYYPSLYDARSHFIVTEAAPLHYMLNRQPFPSDVGQRETWVRLTDRDAIEPLVTDLQLFDDPALEIESIQRFDSVLNTIQTDLLAVGLIGLLFLSSFVGFVLSVVSLLTYASLNVQARKTDFAVLRALGFSTRRVVASMAVEQGLVILVSILLGVGIGLLLSTQVAPVLSFSTTGESLTPPLLVQVEPLLLLAYIGGVIALLFLQLGVSSALVRRLTTNQSLRQPGE